MKENNLIFKEQDDQKKTNLKPILSAYNSLEYVWNRTWGGSEYDCAYGVATDSSDNVYLAGRTESFGGDQDDVCLIKYDKSGNYKWNLIWGGDKIDYCYAIAIDSSDNIYLTGLTASFRLGEPEDFFLVKFNNVGVQLWNRTWGGIDWDGCRAIALDSSENIYLVGYAYNSSFENLDIALVKFNSSGNYQWNRTWGGAAEVSGSGVALDSSDNIYIAGNTASFGAGGQDMCLIKYDSSGEFQWNKTWGGSFSDSCSAIAIDSLNNIYIAGSTYSFGEGNADICLVKYNSSGMHIWNRTWGGSNPENCNAMILDSLDNIYIAGGTSSFGQGYYNMPTRIDDMCLIKYNSSGAQLWNNTWGGVGTESCNAIALDSSDNIYLAGDIDVDLGSDYNIDMGLVKFSSEPQIIINSPDHNEFFGNNAPDYEIFIYVVKGDLNTTWYTLDDGMTNITFNELNGTINQAEWNKKGEGRITIQLYANDTVGNEGYAEIIIRKDISAPISSISFISHSGNNTVNTSTLFTLFSNDGIGCGVSVINYKINESDWVDYYEPFNLSGYIFGDYIISYNAIDAVGNIEEVNTLLVKLIDTDIIPGYDLFILVGIISVISVILIKKRDKIIK